LGWFDLIPSLENSARLPLELSQRRESSPALLGSFPYWGKPTGKVLELSPIGENSLELFWDNPQ